VFAGCKRKKTLNYPVVKKADQLVRDNSKTKLLNILFYFVSSKSWRQGMPLLEMRF
jgi:hypothetical protein